MEKTGATLPNPSPRASRNSRPLPRRWKKGAAPGPASRGPPGPNRADSLANGQLPGGRKMNPPPARPRKRRYHRRTR
ncbi:MAG TPA: hypothetical protein DIC50_05455 [Verrucomicrobia subdivision 3 bacterium]|nr:hypothetical protein [Limisphaerales bacterium]